MSSGARESNCEFDVAIVGGGPVGAALGALLLQASTLAPLRVALFERELPQRAWPAADAATDFTDPLDLRAFALSRASENILRHAGVWPQLTAHEAVLSPYERMHVWPAANPPRGAGSLTFDAAELAEPNLGHIVGNGALQRAALQVFEERGGVLLGEPLQHLEFAAESAQLTSASGTFSAALVVGADGARSQVREAAGLAQVAQAYGQLAIVANLAPERAHESTAWQRFLGHGTLALLPLASGLVSLVWSLPEERARALLEAPTNEFEREVTSASDAVLGSLSLVSERRSFALRRITAREYVRERCALIGDAAHIIHPLAGQGVNLGLQDAATLVEVLEEARGARESLGALGSLRRYQRWRRSENELMSFAMDGINRWLAFGAEPFGPLAERALGYVGQNELLRTLFANRALGLAGSMPRYARSR